MFAVPGWSVSADALKPQTLSAPTSDSQPASSKSKKRKRAGKAPGDVTTSNVADLYESVVEGKTTETKKNEDSSKPDQSAKRQKKDAVAEVKADEGKDKSKSKKKEKKEKKGPKELKEPKDQKEVKEPKESKGKKGQKELEKPDEKTADEEPSLSPKKSRKEKKKANKELAVTAPSPLPPAQKLTPLQASMREKLVSARFRHLNETLYTRPSAESYRLFADDPDMFSQYHEGFRRQVTVWPENPVDSFLADIRARAAAKPLGKRAPGAPPVRLAQMPLPRTGGACTIADLGCGDARLAEELQKDGAKLKLDVRSYDLQSPSPLVTKADIANLPLEDGTVNVAVFCLALMGTNWVDFVEEAFRILHWKGELWVAEIKSRFGPVRGKHAVVSHSVGHRKKALAKKGKADDPDHKDDLAVEVDGADDRRRETDVSAFVEVLRKRGFALHGEREAVDLSNRMFVKMRFMKNVAPTKGKGVKADEATRGRNGVVKWPGPKDDEDEEELDEAAILKPCVYKIR